MTTYKENDTAKTKDKNLQDDWLPNQQRKSNATSQEITEYGGDLKRKDTIKEEKIVRDPESQKDSINWKKKNV